MQQLLIASMLLAAACGSGAAQRSSTPSAANTPVPAGTNVDHEDDVHCGVETPTGSPFSRPICRSDLQREEDRRQADILQRHQETLR
jgi:hypothetical protein